MDDKLTETQKIDDAKKELIGDKMLKVDVKDSKTGLPYRLVSSRDTNSNTKLLDQVFKSEEPPKGFKLVTDQKELDKIAKEQGVTLEGRKVYVKTEESKGTLSAKGETTDYTASEKTIVIAREGKKPLLVSVEREIPGVGSSQVKTEFVEGGRASNSIDTTVTIKTKDETTKVKITDKFQSNELEISTVKEKGKNLDVEKKEYDPKQLLDLYNKFNANDPLSKDIDMSKITAALASLDPQLLNGLKTSMRSVASDSKSSIAMETGGGRSVV